MKKTLLIIAGLIVAAALYIDLSSGKYEDKIQRDVSQITEDVSAGPAKKFTYNQLRGLPEPVQRYFRHVLTDGQRHIRMVMLKQAGEFRVKESARWVPLEAEQYIAAEKASFIWHGRLKPTPYSWIAARDVFYNGTGFMEGRLLAAFPLMFDSGKEIELSSLARFLSEAPWYPTALLPGKNIEWRGIDMHSAEAVLTNSGYRVSAIFTFSDNGEITKVTSEDRYRNVNGNKERPAWTAHYKNYQKYEGIKLPTEVEEEWHLQKGNFAYAKIKIEEIKYQ